MASWDLNSIVEYDTHDFNSEHTFEKMDELHDNSNDFDADKKQGNDLKIVSITSYKPLDTEHIVPNNKQEMVNSKTDSNAEKPRVDLLDQIVFLREWIGESMFPYLNSK